MCCINMQILGSQNSWILCTISSLKGRQETFIFNKFPRMTLMSTADRDLTYYKLWLQTCILHLVA